MIHVLGKIFRWSSASLCVLVLLVWASGCGSKAKTKVVVVEASEPTPQGPADVQRAETAQLEGEPVAAVLMEVDKEVITTGDVLTALAEPLEALGQSTSAEQFRGQAGQLIGQYLRQRTGELLLLNEAKNSLNEEQKKGIEAQVQAYKEQLLRDHDKSPTLLQKKLREKGTSLEEELDKYRRDFQVRIFLRREFSRRININRENIVTYYNSHLGQYSSPKKVELLKIQVLNHKHAQAGQTLEQVRSAVRQIAQDAWGELAGGIPFAEVARKYSDTRREHGGSWGLVDPMSLEERSEREAAQRLLIGQYSRVLNTEIGSSIIGVGKVIPAEQKPLEEVQEEINQSLWNKEYNRLYDQRVGRLQKQAVITVSPAAMRLVVDFAERRFRGSP